jgi:hypothetical protein
LLVDAHVCPHKTQAVWSAADPEYLQRFGSGAGPSQAADLPIRRPNPAPSATDQMQDKGDKMAKNGENCTYPQI